MRKYSVILALVSDKGRSKLKPAQPGAGLNPGPQVRGRIVGSQMPMSVLVSLLSRFERQIVVDLTGLSGAYELKLEWAPDLDLPAGDPSMPAPDRPGLFAAVQEQLGLKLESRRGPLPVLVVEQASRTPEVN